MKDYYIQTDNYNPEELCMLAKQARGRAYAPYSGFAVGAALLCADGSVYLGANVENAAFSPTICAERVAFMKAVCDGERDFCAIAVAGGKADEDAEKSCPPCGVCRQIMAEFCRADFLVFLSNSAGYDTCTLSELLPLSFKLDG